MQWFRLHDEVLDDRKVQQLPPALFKHWINLLCLANKNTPRGTLPDVETIAFRLRLSDAKAQDVVTALTDAGLLEVNDDGDIQPHNWKSRQYGKPSDQPERVAERVRKHRDQERNADVTPRKRDETPLYTETDTEADSETEHKQTQNGTPPTPSRGKRKTPLTDLPPDFAVTDRMREWAKERHHLSDAEIDLKTEHFLNYVEKTAKQYAKWDAAWRDSMGWEIRGSPQPLRPKLPDGCTWHDVELAQTKKRGNWPLTETEQRLLEIVDGRAAA